MPALIDQLQNIKDIGKQTFLLIINPKSYLINKKDNPTEFASTQKTFLWLIASAFLLLKIYSTAFGSIQQDLLNSSPFGKCKIIQRTSEQKTEQNIKPTVYKIVWWSPGFGLGINSLDSCLPANAPQRYVFNVGGLYAIIGNVKSDQFFQTGFSAFILITLTLVFICCIYPAMRVLKRNTDFKYLFNYSLIFIASYLLLGVCLATFVAAIVIHLLGLTGWALYIIWMFAVNLLFFFMLIRGYLISYAEIFSTTRKRLLLGSVVSGFFSWVVSPIVFAPLLYISLWLIPFYDLIVKS